MEMQEEAVVEEEVPEVFETAETLQAVGINAGDIRKLVYTFFYSSTSHYLRMPITHFTHTHFHTRTRTHITLTHFTHTLHTHTLKHTLFHTHTHTHTQTELPSSEGDA